MAIFNVSIWELALKNKLIGAVLAESYNQVVTDFSYDAETNTFVLQFANLERREFSARTKFNFDLTNFNEIKPNKTRGRK